MPRSNLKAHVYEGKNRCLLAYVASRIALDECAIVFRIMMAVDISSLLAACLTPGGKQLRVKFCDICIISYSMADLLDREPFGCIYEPNGWIMELFFSPCSFRLYG